MGRFRFLPWDYGARNLIRRPARTLLTWFGLTLVVALVLTVVGFIRGLEHTLAVSGDPRVVLVHAVGGSENVETSAIRGQTPPILAASLEAVMRRYDQAFVSPEIYLATRVMLPGDPRERLGLVRGVGPAARLVRWRVQIVEGRWPGPSEVMAGRLAAAKLSCRDEHLRVGAKLSLEGREWIVAGRFAAVGSALESELWAPLDELQTATQRQDVSLAALTLAPGMEFADVDEFCRARLDLEIRATAESDYYAALQKHYAPVRAVAWLVTTLVAGAGIFAGMNAMFGSVAGRTKELAMLRTLGFTRRAIVASLLQESALLAAAAALTAAALALLFVNGTAVRFTMGAFALKIDGVALLIGSAAGLSLGVLGALPPAVLAMRQPVATALRAV